MDRPVIAPDPVLPSFYGAVTLILIAGVSIRIFFHVLQRRYDLKGGAGRIKPLGHTV